MKKIILPAIAASLLVPATIVIPTQGAQAREYQYREWRGRDGRVYCRRSNGTTGLVVGGVAGAVVGGAITHGAAGPILGAVAGGLIGREVDRNNKRRHCR